MWILGYFSVYVCAVVDIALGAIYTTSHLWLHKMPVSRAYCLKNDHCLIVRDVLSTS